ncbi:uncharacterized protein F4817DRAFT_367843 [Daldinia loculata]|uniref:uncharacterized protein n=1 Tax=Daldinia loculata TaxID=103429 RepID=UPI0020C1D766|nr:uncharacterized protein F4817DRAFT_367843 [Daldinia loculata]KAI1644119.1 hypothetical protein F4817DRAFT_367843 [Daldinia loculata]
MDANAFPPELQDKIQWAGNGVLTYRDAYTHMKNPPAQQGYGTPPANYHPYGNGVWASVPNNSHAQSQYPPSTSYYPPSSTYQETVYEAESEAESEQDTVGSLSRTNTNRSRSRAGGSQSRGGSRLSSQVSAGGPPSHSSWRPPFASHFGSDRGSVSSSQTGTITLPLTRANVSAVSDASQRIYPTPSQLYNMSPGHSPSPVPRSDTRQYRNQASSPGPGRQSHRRSTVVDLDSVAGGASLWPSGSRRSGA